MIAFAVLLTLGALATMATSHEGRASPQPAAHPERTHTLILLPAHSHYTA